MQARTYRVYQILQLGSNIQQPQGWETQVKSSVPLGCTEQCDCATGMHDDARMMFVWCSRNAKNPTSKTALTTGSLVKVGEINCSHSAHDGVSQGISRQMIRKHTWCVLNCCDRYTVTQGILQVRCWTRRLPSMGHFRGIFHNTSPQLHMSIKHPWYSLMILPTFANSLVNCTHRYEYVMLPGKPARHVDVMQLGTKTRCEIHRDSLVDIFQCTADWQALSRKTI